LIKIKTILGGLFSDKIKTEISKLQTCWRTPPSPHRLQVIKTNDGSEGTPELHLNVAGGGGVHSFRDYAVVTAPHGAEAEGGAMFRNEGVLMLFC